MWTNEVRGYFDSLISSGSLRTIFAPPRVVTYSAASGAFTPPATPTDMWVMEGSATKIVRIYKIVLSGVQTAAGANRFLLIKHSTANAGGTAVASTKISLDSTNPAGTALVQHYTANPTPGTAVGNISSVLALTPVNTSLSTNPILTWDFTNGYTQPVVLRGVAQGLAINFAGAALPAGLSISVDVLFTESDG